MGLFSLRPRIDLQMSISSVNIGSNTSRVSWSVSLVEGNTGTQSPFSGFPENNLCTITFSWAGGSSNPYPATPSSSRLRFVFNFSPAGFQTFVIASSSFDVVHDSAGNHPTITGNASANSNIMGSATASTTHTPANIPPPVPPFFPPFFPFFPFFPPSFPFFPPPAPLASWTTASFTETARIGTAYSKQVTATGIRTTNPYSIASGSLPGGITLNTQSGLISGTATSGATQDFNFTVNAANSDGVVTTSPIFTIQRVQPLPVWSDETLGRPRVGTAYNDQVVVTNAAATNAYSESGLSGTGLTLNANTGAITGTVTSTSTFSFTITAKNSDNQTIQKGFTLTPTARLAVWADQILTTTTVRVNQTYTDGVNATNAVSYALQTPNTLPPGLALNTGTGAITGTPTTLGTYSFRVVASNATTPTAETITTGQLTILVEPSAGGAVWDGTTWAPSVFKVWNGASWIDAPVKIWNGASWADPTN
jgi:hypothetical protein